jgi:hypothetical protein
MLAMGWTRSGVVAVSIVALTWLVTCSSSPAADGGSCGKGTDCVSGRCSVGVCDGSDCTCDGVDCRGRAACDAGWLCTRVDATTDGAIPRCRKQCGDTFGGCPSDKHCDNGICRSGPQAFSLTWLDIPRAKACSSRIPCEYKVKPTDGTTVDKYTWTFGAAPPVETTEPTTTNTYPTGGMFDVKVEAHATTGAVADLMTTENVCDGVSGSACDPNGAPCCEGSCNAQLTCK